MGLSSSDGQSEGQKEMSIELSRVSQQSPEKTRQADSLPLILFCTLIKLSCPQHSHKRILNEETSQELQMLSNVTLNCQVTILNSDSKLSEL